MQTVCCGCFETLSDNERKNVFDETLWISVDDCVENGIKTNETKKQLKLSRSIELITGEKIAQSDKKSVNLCNKCFQNVQLYINLRSRLLYSLRSLNDRSDSINEDEFGLSIERTKVSQNEKDNQLKENVNSISDKVSNNRIIIEDVINVDETSMPLDFNSQLFDQETEIELQNDQENDTLTDLENSNTDSNPSISKEMILKIQDNDIESEIDVCSGEDEEVLELDHQCERTNIVEISTSSESDIEVCDYEPIGKRMKNYHAFSPRLLY
ncbi:uncharacterized protein LOC122401419 [Colletes gigas]|uniref:uncharacterized protein LOC122401419 n=1 Tax=Colletes gigas TaxID=935657 RepID=UPI001C9ABEA9|nr:uncharacterized protein LOC122401419 [Colletes gigas]